MMFLKRLMRLLLQPFIPPISKAQALEIAREEALRRDWPWEEPIAVFRSIYTYEVYTNLLVEGGNVTIVVNAWTGKVIKACFALY